MMLGCAIHSTVKPLPSGTEIDVIYLEENENVLMEGLLEEIKHQISSMGFDVVVVSSGELPADARYRMTFTANWKWDVAMNLMYFRAELFADRRLLGLASYDARSGGASLGKFGATAEKIRPVLREMFQGARPAKK